MGQILKAPFFRLLLPLLCGIIIQYYYHIGMWSIVLVLLGLSIMLFSYFISRLRADRGAFCFGSGIYITLIGIGMISTLLRQEMSTFAFSDVNEIYVGTIEDLAQEKNNTYAYKVRLDSSNKLIVCYFLKEDSLATLNVGDRFSFFSKIEPFINHKKTSRFDYARYMYNSGYSGTSFIRSDSWQRENEVKSTLFILATQSRQHILELFQRLNLSNDEYGLLSALTLGYTDALSDDVLESFRATGVAHVLAVSGMHVAIIFFVIASLFSFISNHSRFRWVKQLSIITLLWMYVFIIGFPPSAVRACIMLSVFCISILFNVKNYSFNTLFLTAFFMLLWNPFWVFSIGFQLSFVAVLSMMLLMPTFSRSIIVKNKYLKYFRDILTMSLSVQLGVFPLCLYYFGTFPSYFLISNLLIIPLVTLIIYIGVVLFSLSAIGLVIPVVADYITYLPVHLFKILVKFVSVVSSSIESLPYAVFDNINLSFFSLSVLWLTIITLAWFLLTKKTTAIIMSLIGVLCLLIVIIWSRIETKDSLTVNNSGESLHLSLQKGYQKKAITNVDGCKFISLNDINYLIVGDDMWKGKSVEEKIKIDYLHLIESHSVSLFVLDQFFIIDKVILDGSLSRKSQQRFVLECEKLRIPYYDVSDNEVLRIFF